MVHPGFNGLRVIHIVQLKVSTLLVSQCYVRYFRIETMFGSSSLPFVS